MSNEEITQQGIDAFQAVKERWPGAEVEGVYDEDGFWTWTVVIPHPSVAEQQIGVSRQAHATDLQPPSEEALQSMVAEAVHTLGLAYDAALMETLVEASPEPDPAPDA